MHLTCVLVYTLHHKPRAIARKDSPINNILLAEIISFPLQSCSPLNPSGVLLTLQRPVNQPPPQQPRFNPADQVASNVGPCYSCGQHGHFAHKCPKKIQGRIPAPNQVGRQGGRFRPPARQNQLIGKVHHMTAEEAQNESDVILGMFPVESSYATVLFDSGATHSFISASFIAQNNLHMILMKDPMIVSTPGGKMKTQKLCPKSNINIRGVDFPSSLIVLESNGLGVILGMDWLIEYKGLIGC